MSSRRRLRHQSSRRSRTDNTTAIAQAVTEQMAAVLPNLVAQITQAMNSNNNNNNGNGNGSGNGNGDGNGENNNNNSSTCTYKHFKSCDPEKYTGDEGATGLLQWFESIEGTFLNSNCPDKLRVQYGTSVFKKRALTWWNSEKKKRGVDTALALSWAEFKTIMTAQFCPDSELKKLEDEFYNLKQDSGEEKAYTTRFHELSLLVPEMVTPLPKAIKKYIRGIPMPIQDTVFGSKPKTLEEAIEMNATLTDNHVKAGKLTRKGEKQSSTSKPTTETVANDSPKTATTTNTSAESSKKRKRKSKNFAVTTTPNPTPAPMLINQIPTQTVAPNRKGYTGPHPMCNVCHYHHATNQPCRLCTQCGRYGHLSNICRSNPPATNQNHLTNHAQQANRAVVLNNQTPPIIIQGPTCYGCGDLGHYRNRCPRLALPPPLPPPQNVPAARGRAFNINANEAKNNADVVNGAVKREAT